MIEIFLLAGAISAVLEPYAIENRGPDNYTQESNANAHGRPFQWTTRQSKPNASNNQGRSNLDNFGNRVDRGGSGRPVGVKE